MNSQPTLLHTLTQEVDLDDAGLVGLLAALSPSGTWIREGDGLLGLGIAAAATAVGAERFAELAEFWERVQWAALNDVRGSGAALPGDGPGREGLGRQGLGRQGLPSHGFSHAELPGSGPVAFSSVAFSATSSYASRLLVPRLVVGAKEGRSWITAVSPEPQYDLSALLNEHGLTLDHGVLRPNGAMPDPALPAVQLRAGTQSERQYLHAVSAGLSAIAEGTVQKLVLARDVVVDSSDPLPAGVLLARLAADYAECWTYSVGQVSGGQQAVLGATPEMLVSLRGERLSSRVLAGTVDRAGTDQEVSPEQAALRLLGDAKQHLEHDLAVQSLTDQLAPVTDSLQSPSDPQVLRLPNVYHLATDVTGVLTADATGALPSPLRVAEQAHPTAAVCGTPTREAGQLLEMLEGLDRGPFAGPVGWMDTFGNADFGIALRGGVLESQGSDEAPERGRMRLYAGCGIVADSVPEEELAETRSKLRPMLSALGLQ